MRVSQINSTAAFSAKTKVQAPEKWVSKEQIKKYEELGSKIGKPTDSIDIKVSDVYKKDRLFNKKVFDVDYIMEFDGNRGATHETIPLFIMTPVNYLDKFFRSIK